MTTENQAPEGGPTVKESLTAAYGDKWQGAEEWMPLAWELCANECGEDACTELIWEGGPIPEPWGDRWLKYEDQAKEMIAMVRKHVRPQPDVQQAPAAQVQPIGVEAVARVYTNDDGEPAIEWLLEGGIHAASDGGESLLLVSHEPITNDEGYGEVYLAQPQPKGTEPMCWLATRLWNARELWTCPADIEKMLKAQAQAPAQ